MERTWYIIGVDFHAEQREHDGFPLLYLQGELDIAVEEDLRRAVAAAVDSNLCAIMNVVDVTYSDATSIEMLVHARQIFTERGGRLVFVCCDAQVFRVLQTLGFTEHMDIFDDLEDASRFLRSYCPGDPHDASSVSPQ